jgi:sn-glycerol 3-phosphate transport system substrate-binding protein
MNHRHVKLAGVAGCIAGTVLAGCASGDTILNAGNDGTRPTTVAPVAPAGPGGSPSAPTTIQLFPAEPQPAASAPPAPTTIVLFPPASVSGFRTSAAPVAPAAIDYAPCPIDALESADGPVRITFWHGMQSAAEEALQHLTDEYNASQDRVVVELQNQNGYEELVDKYFQSSQEDRPNLIQLPEYMLQQMADTNTVVSSTACIQAEGYDTSAYLPRALLAYQTGGVQWGLPFNISNPVLYYNQQMFEAAGLDPEQPPVTLEQLREYSEQIVESGAATYGIAFDSGVNSGGGWFLEQWLARAGLPYADNGNGREARATQVLFDSPEAAGMLQQVQDLVTDGLAVYVGENTAGTDVLLQLADQEAPAAMGIATSGALGTVLSVVEGGLIPGVTVDDIGVGPMPGPTETPSAIVGGAALYIVRDKGDAEAAASWDFVKFLDSPESQSYWADATGYVPIREDAITVDPIAQRYEDDPRYLVAYDQITFAADDFSAVGPVIGPLRQVRGATAQMMADIYNGTPVADALGAAADQANLLIADYNSRQ